MTGVFAISIFTIVLIIKVGENSKPIGVSPKGNFAEFFATFPDLFLAYTFHYNIFPIYESLKEKTNWGMMKAGGGGVLLSCTVYTIVGIVGYCMYGTAVEGNIIANLAKSSDTASMVAKFAYTLSSVMSFPLLYLGARNNI
jgi:amino acid permease